MSAFIDMQGRRCARLTVIAQSGPHTWLCKCDCGRESIVDGSALRRGHTQSCGCLKLEMIAERGRAQATHGHTRQRARHPEYGVWVGMWDRCTRTSGSQFAYYRARGISVCERWRTYENFLADMGPRPPGTSIDRINNDGNYEPGNCRWATPREQRNNVRVNRLLTLGAQTYCVAEWARRTGLSESLIRKRMKNGWGAERALTEPKHVEKSRGARA